MFVLGLTGSVAMGKSTTACFFAEEGVPVHDADSVVHRLYENEAVPLIEAAFPGTTADGKVDRVKLGSRVMGDLAALRQLEAIVHPLVWDAERRFLADAEANGAPVVLPVAQLASDAGLKTPIRFRFRYFEEIAAELTIPEGFRPSEVRVSARPDGQKAKTVEESFVWNVKAE